MMRCGIEGRRACLCSIAAAVWMCPAASWSQAYPVKPVRYVVPFPAGASPDIVARLLAERFTKLWGQQVLVDNRSGAGGIVGAASVAKSPADGYTLFQCNVASSAIALSLYAKPGYDQLRDFASISRIGMTPNALIVHPSMPARTMKEFIALARANPGKVSYGSSAAGTSPHLTMELLNLTAKINVVHVPYKGAPQAISDVIGGQIPAGISNVPALLAPIQSGRVRPLAVTSAKRISHLPEVPTMQEAGLPDFEVTSWYGVCAPAGTPAPVLDKLHADVTTVLRMPEIQQRFNELVIEVAPNSREEFTQFIRAEIARWAHVIKEAKIVQQ